MAVRVARLWSQDEGVELTHVRGVEGAQVQIHDNLVIQLLHDLLIGGWTGANVCTEWVTLHLERVCISLPVVGQLAVCLLVGGPTLVIGFLLRRVDSKVVLVAR